jgi:excisionase family DNA binding protein
MVAVISAAEFARRVGVNQATVVRWIERGYVLGAYRTPGGHWRIPESEAVCVIDEKMYDLARGKA